MKLSIIIPVYNGEETIARCLSSIFNQKIGQDMIEVIVVDDCSTDGTVKVVDSLQITPPQRNRLRLLKLHENSRQGAARNAGVNIAQGEYIQYLDADDYLIDGSLSKLFSSLESTDCDILMFDSETRTEQNRLIDSLHYANNPQKIISGENFLATAEVPWVPWLTVFKKTFLMDNRIKFAEKVRFEDTDYMLKAFLLAKTVEYLPINVVCHNINLQSTVHIGNDSQKIRECFMTSGRISQTIAEYAYAHPVGTKVVDRHNIFLYSSLIKRTLWRLSYADILSIIKAHPFKGANPTPFVAVTMKFPKVYAILSQIVRPLLLIVVKLRNLLK